jgi:hypothetical protein
MYNRKSATSSIQDQFFSWPFAFSHVIKRRYSTWVSEHVPEQYRTTESIMLEHTSLFSVLKSKAVAENVITKQQ